MEDRERWTGDRLGTATRATHGGHGPNRDDRDAPRVEQSMLEDEAGDADEAERDVGARYDEGHSGHDVAGGDGDGGDHGDGGMHEGPGGDAGGLDRSTRVAPPLNTI